MRHHSPRRLALILSSGLIAVSLPLSYPVAASSIWASSQQTDNASVPGLPAFLQADIPVPNLSSEPHELLGGMLSSHSILMAAAPGSLKRDARTIPTGKFSRIVGGTDARRGEFPFVTALYLDSNSRVGNFFCGGTLINEEYVLTAAHCVKNSFVSGVLPARRIVLEINNLDLRQTPSAPALVRKVTQVKVHPDFKDPRSGALENDAALLKLADQVTSLNPVALVRSNGSFYKTGAKATIIGYGTTSEGGSISPRLQKANVPIVSNTTCNSTVSYDGLIKPNMLCAGFKAGGVDSCQGDSGGALLRTLDGKRYTGGITSWGDGCARPNKYGVYARLGDTKIKNWIVKNSR